MKVDLRQLLLRRRVTLARYLEEQNIKTETDYLMWRHTAQNEYLISEEFEAAILELVQRQHITVSPVEVYHTQEAVDELTKILDSEFQKTEKRPSEIVNVTAPKDVAIEEEEPKKKKNKSPKGVHTSETEE